MAYVFPLRKRCLTADERGRARAWAASHGVWVRALRERPACDPEEKGAGFWRQDSNLDSGNQNPASCL